MKQNMSLLYYWDIMNNLTRVKAREIASREPRNQSPLVSYTPLYGEKD